MQRYNDTVDEKTAKEKPPEEMEYQSTLDWRFMKKLRSETKVRHWHIKVDLGKKKANGQPQWEDFNIAQVWFHRQGEQLFAYRATRSGRPEDLLKDRIFMKRGQNYLHAIEYLLRHLEGQDISEMRLDLVGKDYIG